MIKGFTMQQLGDSLSPSVSRQSINKYEKGQMMPDSTMLIELSRVLGVKPDYLFRPFTVGINTVRFRKTKSFSAREAAVLKEKVREELERYLEVEQICGTISEFSLSKINVESEEEAAKAAIESRDRLGLGTAGISNVIEVLEDSGVKIIEVTEDLSFEGLSGYANETVPLIVINSVLSSEQKRFTLLHELAHLVLSVSADLSKRQVEVLCNVFASELLLPSSVLVSRMGSTRHDISLAELTDIQKQFGISIDCIMASLRRNGVISSRRYDGYMIKKESYPGFKALVEQSLQESETSGRFVRLVYRALADGLISTGKAAALMNTTSDNVKSRLQLV